ncbi:MAG: Spy/CpxP family protein refolding chaperone [Colwellia sp.]
MNKKLLNTILGAFTSVALVFSAASYSNESNSEYHSDAKGELSLSSMSDKKLAKLTNYLSLSEEQVSQIKALKQEEKEALAKLKPAMKALKKSVSELMEQESFDEGAFIALQDANRDTISSIALIKVKSKFAMKQVLNDEQWVKMTELKKMRGKRSRH